MGGLNVLVLDRFGRFVAAAGELLTGYILHSDVILKGLREKRGQNVRNRAFSLFLVRFGVFGSLTWGWFEMGVGWIC
jgi:hypothetical protein